MTWFDGSSYETFSVNVVPATTLDGGGVVTTRWAAAVTLTPPVAVALARPASVISTLIDAGPAAAYVGAVDVEPAAGVDADRAGRRRAVPHAITAV